MNLKDKYRMRLRFWRYRLRTEKNDIKFLLDQNLKGAVVVDIGANKGIYSYWMSKKVGKEGKVVAFEPQPELVGHLMQLKAEFSLTNLEIVNKGLSSSLGQLQLFRAQVCAGDASFHRIPDGDYERLTVDVTTLDDYFLESENRPVKFIKCDVEGHELKVFKGGEQLLLEDKPDLLFECSQDEAEKGDLFSYLLDLGYDGFFAEGNKLIHFSEFNNYRYSKPSVTHRNYIFLAKHL